jgi:hypothetical protein
VGSKNKVAFIYSNSQKKNHTSSAIDPLQKPKIYSKLIVRIWILWKIDNDGRNTFLCKCKIRISCRFTEFEFDEGGIGDARVSSLTLATKIEEIVLVEGKYIGDKFAYKHN